MEKKKFIPKAKLSKKAKKELDAQQRKTWHINPISRKTENKKAYNRKRADKPHWEGNGSFFMPDGDVVMM